MVFLPNSVNVSMAIMGLHNCLVSFSGPWAPGPWVFGILICLHCSFILRSDIETEIDIEIDIDIDIDIDTDRLIIIHSIPNRSQHPRVGCDEGRCPHSSRLCDPVVLRWPLEGSLPIIRCLSHGQGQEQGQRQDKSKYLNSAP